MRVLVIAIAATIVAHPALAQDAILTDAQRRKAHLPAIRAATGCIANSVLGQPNSTDLLIPGREGSVLVEAIRACFGVLQVMVGEHDRLYGPGTGMPFYQGPYLNDLPRALLVRIRPQLEAVQANRAAEQARQEAARRAEKERAEEAKRAAIETTGKARDLLRDRMYGCTNREIVNLASSGERAEVLASAAMTVCRKEVDEAIAAHIEAVSALGGKTDWESLRSAVRESVTTSAVQVRANVGRESKAAPTPVKQVEPPVRKSPVSECLNAASSIQRGRFVEVNKLAQVMMDLCRPEIETEARRAFLDDEVKTLDEAREKVVGNAMAEAKQIAGP